MRLPFKRTAPRTKRVRKPKPVPSPGHEPLPITGRKDADVVTGHSDRLRWGSRSDVGLVRGHNEDSFLVQAPLFAVCDGMGGHAAGEVASAIAVRTLSQLAPSTADDAILGGAVEEANSAIIESAQSGEGKEGMGCTASAIVIDKNHMAVAHVGDSRVYLMSGGVLVRVTHDHSYVEELVDAGQITTDEARVHPSRSIITRALLACARIELATTHNMDVEVVDCLPRIVTGIGDEPESGLVNASLLYDDAHSVDHGLKYLRRDIVENVLVVLLRYHQNMDRRQWIGILKGGNQIVLVDHLARNLAGSDLAENTILTHV